jgi:hypothetical protein
MPPDVFAAQKGVNRFLFSLTVEDMIVIVLESIHRLEMLKRLTTNILVA